MKVNPITCFNLEEAEVVLNMLNSDASVLCVNDELTRCKIVRNLIEAVDFYEEK